MDTVESNLELIKIISLSKNFGNNIVLDNVNLYYAAGRIYGIVGENGAGKTTFFNCLVGLLDFEGDIIKASGIQIGYLPAENYFYPLITGMEYLEFCLKAKKISKTSAEIEAINQVFFNLPLYRYASEYSTGMKKKLAFMALFLQNNDLYILDEPFNGVDLKGCILLKQLIVDLKQQGKTILISSHLITMLHELCDSIDYLYNHTIKKRYVNETVEEIEFDILNF